MVVRPPTPPTAPISRLLAGGALAYLTKPIELTELGTMLDTLAAARAQDHQRGRLSGCIPRDRPGRRAPSPGPVQKAAKAAR